MKQIVIDLTEAEYHALATEAKDVHHLIENFAKNRARRSIDAHYKNIVKKKLELGEPISGTREEIFLNADIPTLEETDDKDPNTASLGD